MSLSTIRTFASGSTVLRRRDGLAAELFHCGREYYIPSPLGGELVLEANAARMRFRRNPSPTDNFASWLSDTADAVAYALTPASERTNTKPEDIA